MDKCDFCKHDRGPLVGRLDICATCHHHDRFQPKERMNELEQVRYEKILRDEEWINDKSEEFDRATALKVLQALSHKMRPSLNMYGEKTLIISRYEFEVIRRKYLD